jgi:hypothetical protein
MAGWTLVRVARNRAHDAGEPPISMSQIQAPCVIDHVGPPVSAITLTRLPAARRPVSEAQG